MELTFGGYIQQKKKTFVPITEGMVFQVGKVQCIVKKLKDKSFLFTYEVFPNCIHQREVTFNFWYYNATKWNNGTVYLNTNSSMKDTMIFKLKKEEPNE